MTTSTSINHTARRASRIVEDPQEWDGAVCGHASQERSTTRIFNHAPGVSTTKLCESIHVAVCRGKRPPVLGVATGRTPTANEKHCKCGVALLVRTRTCEDVPCWREKLHDTTCRKDPTLAAAHWCSLLLSLLLTVPLCSSLLLLFCLLLFCFLCAPCAP